MPARTLKPRHQDEIRTKIQTSQLLNVLMNHITGKKLCEKDSQITAAIALLRKTLPDLSAVDMKAEVNHQSLSEILIGLHSRTTEEVDRQNAGETTSTSIERGTVTSH